MELSVCNECLLQIPMWDEIKLIDSNSRGIYKLDKLMFARGL